MIEREIYNSLHEIDRCGHSLQAAFVSAAVAPWPVGFYCNDCILTPSCLLSAECTSHQLVQFYLLSVKLFIYFETELIMAFATTRLDGYPIICVACGIHELCESLILDCGEPARMQACFIVSNNSKVGRAVKKKSRFNLLIKQPTSVPKGYQIESRAVAVVTARHSKSPPCYLSSFI